MTTTRSRTPAKAPAAAAAAPATRGARSPAATARSTTAAAVAEALGTNKETKLTVTVTRRNEDATVREEVVEVNNFLTHPAYVKVKHGATRQVVQYEGIRVDVEISRPCYVEEIDDVLAEISEMAANKVYDELEQLMSGEIVQGGEATPQPEPEPELEEAPYTYEELGEMDLKALKAVLKEQGLKAPTGKASDADAIFEHLINHFGLEAGEPDAEGEDAGDITYAEVSQLGDEELVQFAADNGVTIPRNKKTDMDFIFNAVCEAFGLSADSEEGNDPYTYEELEAMTDEQILDVADANGIEIDESLLDSADEVFFTVCEALGVEIPEEAVTAEQVNAMELDELEQLVADFAETDTPITVSSRESKNVALFRKAAIKSLGL